MGIEVWCSVSLNVNFDYFICQWNWLIHISSRNVVRRGCCSIVYRFHSLRERELSSAEPNSHTFGSAKETWSVNNLNSETVNCPGEILTRFQFEISDSNCCANDIISGFLICHSFDSSWLCPSIALVIKYIIISSLVRSNNLITLCRCVTRCGGWTTASISLSTGE